MFFKIKNIMRARLLRKALLWAAPLIIGFIVKKIEERQMKKQEEKAGKTAF